MRNMPKQTFILASLLISLILGLQACAPVVVAGAATGISLANDRRNASVILNDQDFELRAQRALRQHEALSQQAHIVVTSYNNVVLLTGQAPNTDLQDQAVEIVQRQGSIKRLHNEIRIGPATTLKARSQDTWLTTQIKGQLIGDRRLNGLQIKVITENSQTFLMGLVTHSEADRAAHIARQITGVTSVVKVFEYTD